MTTMVEFVIQNLKGQAGGIFATGLISGGALFWKFAVPKLIRARMEAMQAQIDFMKQRVELYDALANKALNEKLEGTKNG